VQKALLYLENDYDAYWPEKGTELENPGAIIILDEVEVTEQIVIDGSVGYPPIILCDDPETSGGTLRANANMASTIIISFGKCLVHITDGAKVTLAGGLVLSGTGDVTDGIRGVTVSGSTFTMNGGKISGFYTSTSFGGGLYLWYGTFTMNGGEISGNSAGYSFTSGWNPGIGGGVFIQGGTFTMNGGKISRNFTNSGGSSDAGGGVYMYDSTVTINAGEISGNISSGYGGGVFIQGSTFTMHGGTISGNSCIGSSHTGGRSGGGVFMSDGGTFTMDGGEIWGNTTDSLYGGGVHLFSPDSTVFNKTGGTIYGYDSENPDDQKNNKVKEVDGSGNILNNRGHAVYLDDAHRKETTVGPGDILYYNYPDTPDSGW
jgi:hypothetical protein